VGSVASSVLNYVITCLEKNLSSVVQFEIHFAKDNDVEIHRVGSVHTRMIRFEEINPPRQLLLNFFESRRCALRGGTVAAPIATVTLRQRVYYSFVLFP